MVRDRDGMELSVINLILVKRGIQKYVHDVRTVRGMGRDMQYSVKFIWKVCGYKGRVSE